MNEADVAMRKALENSLRVAERIAPTVESDVVRIWRKTERQGRATIGAGFFFEFDGNLYLVTALHNFTDNPGRELFIEHSGVVHSLNDMACMTSPRDDLWVVEIVGALKDVVGSCAFVLTRKSANARRLSLGAVLIGFPQLADSMQADKPFALSTHLEVRTDISTPTVLPEPIVYSVDGDMLSDAAGVPVMALPELYGMSGGPAIGWHLDQTPEGAIVLYTILQGFMCAWNKERGYVIACNAERIIDLLSAS